MGANAWSPASFEALLNRFPAVRARIEGAAPDGPIRGQGPLRRTGRGPVEGGLIRVGDAAGYVDAVTGDGLSLAFACAQALERSCPRR